MFGWWLRALGSYCVAFGFLLLISWMILLGELPLFDVFCLFWFGYFVSFELF